MQLQFRNSRRPEFAESSFNEFAALLIRVIGENAPACCFTDSASAVRMNLPNNLRDFGPRVRDEDFLPRRQK